MVVDLLGALDHRLEQDPDQLLADYRENCSTLGREVVVEGSGRMITGVAVDVDERGALEVRTDDRAVTVDAGDVIHVLPGASGS